MTSRAGRRCCGFTLIESAVVAALFAVCVAMLASRVPAYDAEAERVAAEQLVGTLRAALQVRSAKALIAGGEQGLHVLLDENPLGWLSEKPANYLGEFYAPDREELPNGNWYFDRADRSLVYLARHSYTFSLRTTTFLKFKVKLSLLPNLAGSNGRSKTSTGVFFDQVLDRDAAANNAQKAVVPH